MPNAELGIGNAELGKWNKELESLSAALGPHLE